MGSTLKYLIIDKNLPLYSTQIHTKFEEKQLVINYEIGCTQVDLGVQQQSFFKFDDWWKGKIPVGTLDKIEEFINLHGISGVFRTLKEDEYSFLLTMNSSMIKFGFGKQWIPVYLKENPDTEITMLFMHRDSFGIITYEHDDSEGPKHQLE